MQNSLTNSNQIHEAYNYIATKKRLRIEECFQNIWDYYNL